MAFFLCACTTLHLVPVCNCTNSALSSTSASNLSSCTLLYHLINLSTSVLGSYNLPSCAPSFCYILSVTFCLLHFVCYILSVTFCVLHSVCYILCVTFCVLHSVCYILFFTFCVLHSVCYILSVTFCVLHFVCYILSSCAPSFLAICCRCTPYGSQPTTVWLHTLVVAATLCCSCKPSVVAAYPCCSCYSCTPLRQPSIIAANP